MNGVSQVQQHQTEASRLRQEIRLCLPVGIQLVLDLLQQDVLRLQTLADERELTVEKVQKREDSSSEKASCGIMTLMTHLFFCLKSAFNLKSFTGLKARIFRGWLCGFRTYFQYIYIYIHISYLLQHLRLWEISFRLLRCKSDYKRCRVRCSQKLVTFGFKVHLKSAEHVELLYASEERGKLQETEVELYRARESLSSVGVTAVTVVYQASYSTTITCPFCITWLRPEKKWMMWSIWKRWFLARVVF